MRLSDVQSFFADKGLSFSWSAVATPAAPLRVDVSVVIPDVHLGVGPGDAFQESDPSRVTRLETFLDVLANLRDALPAGRFAAVQLGDFFDVMRSSKPGASFDDRLDIVFKAYPGVASRARALPLLHCIGNHDHELWNNQTTVEHLGINAHIVRAIGPGVLAFHGHDLISLRDEELSVAYQTWLLSLVQGLVDMPVLGPVADAIERFFDQSLADPIFDAPQFTSLPWPASSVSVPGWTAPWIMRDNQEQLGEPLLDWERTIEQRLELAIVGHSHRPGIGSCEVDFGRRIPLVDVGSWTYGRSNFAVVCADGVGVASL